MILDIESVVSIFKLFTPLQQVECFRQLQELCSEIISSPCVFRIGQGGWADPAAFPSDLVRRITLYLDLNSVLTCRQVCRHWQRVIDSDELMWRREGTRLGLELPSLESVSLEAGDEEISEEASEKQAREAELSIMTAELKVSARFLKFEISI